MSGIEQILSQLAESMALVNKRLETLELASGDRERVVDGDSGPYGRGRSPDIGAVSFGSGGGGSVDSGGVVVPQLSSRPGSSASGELVGEVGEDVGPACGDKPEPVASVGKKQPHGGVGGGGSFYSRLVHVPATRAMAFFIGELVGAVFPDVGGRNQPRVDLAMACYTAGTLPAEFEGGRHRLTALAVVGDAALSDALIKREFKRGVFPASMQEARTRYLSNENLRNVFLNSQLAHMVQYGSVDMRVSKTAGTAIEVVAGVISLYMPYGSVSKYAEKIGVF